MRVRVVIADELEAQVVDLFREVREKLVGGETGGRLGRSGILAGVRSSGLGLWDGNRLFGRLLVIGGNERFRLEDKFEILLELKFRFWFGRGRSGLYCADRRGAVG